MGSNRFFKIIAYAVIPLFLIVVAVVAFIISRGGLFTDNGIVFDTGTIRINTSPENVQYTAFVDGTKAVIESNRVRVIQAGEYVLRIEAAGYEPWENKVSVTDNAVTDVFVKFYPKDLSLTQITHTNIDRAFFSTNGESVYYMVKSSEFSSERGIWRLNLNQNPFLLGISQNQPIKIANFADEYNQDKYEIIPSPGNDRILYKDLVNKVEYVLNAQSLNAEVPPTLESILGYTPESVEWSVNSNSVLVKDSNLLIEHNISSNVDNVVSYVKNRPLIYAIGGTKVYLFDDKENTLSSYANQTTTPIATSFTFPSGVSALYGSSNENFLIYKTSTGFYMLDLQRGLNKQIADGKLNLIHVSVDGKAAVFSDDKNTLVTFTYTEDVANNKAITHLYPTSYTLANPNQVKFAANSAYILLYTKSHELTSILALDKDGTNPVKLVNESSLAAVDFDFNTQADGLFVVMQDKAASSSNPVFNLYQIKLNKVQ